MVRLVHNRQDSIRLSHVSYVEALPHPTEAVLHLIALENLHLDQTHLVLRGATQVGQVALDFLGQVSDSTFVLGDGSMRLESRVGAGPPIGRPGSFPDDSLGFGAHLVLSQVGLDALRDHLTQNVLWDVVKRLVQGKSHLVTNLPFQEIV